MIGNADLEAMGLNIDEITEYWKRQQWVKITENKLTAEAKTEITVK